MKSIRSNPRQDLATHTFITKYARYLKDQKRYETIAEASKRVMDMHRKKYAGKGLDQLMDKLEVSLAEGKILGSQRATQFGGDAIIKKNIRGFNCAGSHFNRVNMFQEYVWLGLCGTGCGVSVQKHHVDKLPTLQKPRKDFDRHVVEDSIEGWADAFGALLKSYIGFKNRIVFDYSRVRPEGSELSSSSAKAPGPKLLRDAIEACREHLDRVCEHTAGKIRPIDAYDLLMHAADCIRAGGIRRSATIIFFDRDDVEMLAAKTGDWFRDNPQRRLSNNSAMLPRHEISQDDFVNIFTRMKEYGEPGLSLNDSKEHVANPCSTAESLICTEDGWFPIKELLGTRPNIWVIVDGEKKLVPTTGVFPTAAQQPILRLKTQHGHSIRATRNHKFPVVGGGFKEMQELTLNDKLYALDVNNNVIETHVSCIEEDGIEDVYCLNQPDHNLMIVNGISTRQCHEISFDPVDHEGIRNGLYTNEADATGWGFCNLTSVNVAKCRTGLDFLEASHDAAVLGTLQAGYDDCGYLNTLSPASQNIMRRDYLLGVSLTGLADQPEIGFDAALLREGVKLIRATNAVVAEAIGILPAARLTCVKPEGTGSLVVQAASGVHPHHSRRYIRHVMAGKASDPINRFIASVVPEAVIPSAYNPDEVVIAFPIDLGEGELWVKNDTAAVKHLELVKLVQTNWVKPGTNRDLLTNNVSNTVIVRPDEWGDVRDFVWENRNSFAGVSFLPHSGGDLVYQQAPYVEVLTKEEIDTKYAGSEFHAKAVEMAELFDVLTQAWDRVGGIPWDKFSTDVNQEAGIEVVACAGGACLF